MNKIFLVAMMAAFLTAGAHAALPDTTAPTVPSGLSATAYSATQINLSWTASTDAVGVTAYKIYRDGSLLTTINNVTYFSDTGLTPSATYVYTVAACDAAGLCSQQSPPATNEFAVKIALGGTHSCAITSAGRVKCWGNNNYGQLGDNSTTTRLTPVVTHNSSGFKSIALGREHSCALSSDSIPKCWGNSENGQTGIVYGALNTIPRSVQTLNPDPDLQGSFEAIASGNLHSCGLFSTGHVFCWGSNTLWQIGDRDDRTGTTYGIDAHVSDLSGVTKIAAGRQHSCALTQEGIVKCWGDDNYNQLGSPSNTYPGAKTVEGLSGVTAIAAGGLHSCALTQEGIVKCWGGNGYGQLGGAFTSISGYPYTVDGLSDVTAIAAGDDHSCALTRAGIVKCWGGNGNGQLGLAFTSTYNLRAKTVEGLSGVTAIAAGGQHSCALTQAGIVKCWGDNRYGQLGDNSTTQRLTPVYVKGLGDTRDADSDGVEDATDNCPLISNVTQLNTDGDAQGNACDSDDDGDKVLDDSDNCPLIANASQLDSNADGLGDACDSKSDADSDGIVDVNDNCPLISNPSQTNTDTDSNGDACDSNDDNDGVPDASDNCPLIPNTNQLDWDDDGKGDKCDDPVPMPADATGVLGKDKAGAAVAFAGDFNKDGYGDYVIGIPGFNVSAKLKDAGRAEVISGKNGSVLASINGSAAKDALGAAVAGNADVDDDGYDDVAVGAPNAGVSHTGSVTILYGPDGTHTQTINGTVTKSLFGSALALGDVNRDIFADILVGAPKDDDLATKHLDAGSVTVLSGNGFSELKKFYGASAKANAGTSVASSDINNDGMAEIIIGAPNDDGRGSVKVYNIAGTILLDLLNTISDVPWKSQFGKSVASGDVNGDRFDDVLVGAPLNDFYAGIKDSGSVWVYSGKSGKRLAGWSSRVAGANLGASIAAGDVNGDGFADIIVGASKDDKPAAKVIKDAGSVFVYSGKGYEEIGALYGNFTKDYFGTAVSAGYINSDGKADLIIGIPGFDLPTAKDAGAVKVLSGAGF